MSLIRNIRRKVQQLQFLSLPNSCVWESLLLWLDVNVKQTIVQSRQDQNIQSRSPHPIKDEMDNGKIKGLVSQTFHQSLHFILTLLPLLSLVQNLLRKVTCLFQALFLFLLVVLTVSNFKEHLGQKTETLMKLTNLHISCWFKRRAQNIALGTLYKSHSYYLVGCHLSGKLELIQLELLQRYNFWDCRPGYLKYIISFPTDSCFHMAQY